jgi:HK97 family phage prohead protease
MTDTITATVEHPPEAKILRTLRGYCKEWHYRYHRGLFINRLNENHQYSFLPGCYDRCLARKRDIPLTRDLDGKTVFARTGDNTLVLESDDFGLMAHVTLLDTPQNRELCDLIDAGKVRGWSQRSLPVFGGSRVTKENGVTLQEHRIADLTEVTLVVKKWPRAKTRKTPIFLFGGPHAKGIERA